MSDPFACLDPIQKPKSSLPQYGAPPAPVQPLSPSGNMYGAPVKPPMGMGMGGFNMGVVGGMGPNGMNSMGMGGMNMGMGVPSHQQLPPQQHGMGMNMGMGMGMDMGMGAPYQQQQQPPQQQGPMYDNIKNLLAQKPKPAGVFTDDTSMDFLENLGSPKANSVASPAPVSHTHVVDPFGPSLPVTQPLNMNVSSFAFPGENISTSAPTSASNTPTNGGAKSSALADRLAHGRRKTQEDQRQQLGLNAGAFAHPGSSPRISLKGMAPPVKQGSLDSIETTPVPSLDDFASGKPVFSPSSKTSSRDFGKPVPSTPTAAPPSSGLFDDDNGVFSDSDADFDNKLHGHSNTRNISGGAVKQSPPAPSNDTFW